MEMPDVCPFHFFQFVWMRIDEDGESPGMGQVIGILYKPGAVLFQVQWGMDRVAFHYAAEITADKPQHFA